MTKTILRTTCLILFSAAPLCAQTTGFDLSRFLGAGVVAVLAMVVFYWFWEKLENHRGILIAIMALVVIGAIHYWPSVLRWMRGSAITLDIK
jgi:hypothetical protein